MFLVLAVHSGYRFMGAPSADMFHNNPSLAFWLVFNQCMSVICVNVFVMISGWFGIRLSMRKLINYIFQCMYFIVGIYLLAVIIGFDTLTLKGVMNCLLLTKSYWFVKCFLALMLVSPILNIFVDNATRTLQKKVLISIFVFQTIFGWLHPATGFINDGYSLFSFVFIYLLMRYIRIYPGRLTELSVKMVILILLSCLSLNIALSFILVWLNHSLSISASYINPLVIVQALFVVLLFSKLNFQNRIINFISQSCFAVFLLHTHESLFVNYYGAFVMFQYANNNIMIAITNIILMMITVFIFAVLLDQPRKLMWRFIN